MPLWNYSSLRRREKKIYSLAGTQISSTGISVSFLKIVAPFAIFTALIGIIICVILQKNLMFPLDKDFNFTFTIISIGSGTGVGLALWYIKVQTYRLYEYLIAYLRPKYTYHNLNTRNIKFDLNNVKEKGLIKSDL